MPIKFYNAGLYEACAEFMWVLLEGHSDLPYRLAASPEYRKEVSKRRAPIVLNLKGREGSELEECIATASFDTHRFGVSLRKNGVLAKVVPISGISPTDVAALEQKLVTYLTPTLRCEYSQN